MNITEKERFIKKIENQIWYDSIKCFFPVEINKIVDLSSIYRYDDLVRIIGNEKVMELKIYFQTIKPISNIDILSLSYEELSRIDFLIDMFPMGSVEGDFNLTFIIEKEIEGMHEERNALVRG